MFEKGIYKNKSKKENKEDLKKLGFNPLIIINGPEDRYPKHQHAETKLLVFLKGSMGVHVQDKVYHCKEGDKLIVPGNTQHWAVVGKEGCTFFWSEKIV